MSDDELLELARSLDERFEAVADRLTPSAPPETSSPLAAPAPATVERVGIRATALFRQLEVGLKAKLRREPSEAELSALEVTLSRRTAAAAAVRPADEFLAPTSQTAAFLQEDEVRREELAERSGYSLDEIRGFEASALRIAQRQVEERTRPRRPEPTLVAELSSSPAPSASAADALQDVTPKAAAARQAVLELGAHLESLAEREKRNYRPRVPRTRLQKKFGRLVDDVTVQVHEALAEKRIGPQLKPFQRRCSAIYVQQEDLEDVIPDGWGLSMPLEAQRLARRIGLPPAAVPLLCLLTWTSSFVAPLERDTHSCGAGFQVSIAWLARKLGCSTTWVKQLLNRLDPQSRWRREVAHVRKANKSRRRHGRRPLPEPTKPSAPVYIHRFRRLVPYEGPARANGRSATIWVDAAGRAHRHVDIRGVVYLTSTGRRALVRRASHTRSRAELLGQATPQVRPIGYRTDAWARTRRQRWLVSARLRRSRSLVGGGSAVELLGSRRELEGAPALKSELPPSYTTFFRERHL
ncbi:MAG: hypothetical protein Q8L14_23645 [Myxococcales bacterium]|nr:hypothetical protein [Myxococcales bacterium]